MKLYIDTSSSEKIIVGINGQMHETDSRKEKSQKLLSFIVELFERKDMELKDISEVEINTGPGSFTGLRVGVSVAQALGWTLGVLVNGKDILGGGILEIEFK